MGETMTTGLELEQGTNNGASEMTIPAVPQFEREDYAQSVARQEREERERRTLALAEQIYLASIAESPKAFNGVDWHLTSKLSDTPKVRDTKLAAMANLALEAAEMFEMKAQQWSGRRRGQ